GRGRHRRRRRVRRPARAAARAHPPAAARGDRAPDDRPPCAGQPARPGDARPAARDVAAAHARAALHRGDARAVVRAGRRLGGGRAHRGHEPGPPRERAADAAARWSVVRTLRLIASAQPFTRVHGTRVTRATGAITTPGGNEACPWPVGTRVSTHTPRLSVLDLVPVRSGQTSTQAVRASLDLVRLADRLGFERYWFAEHHNMPAVAASTPPVMIATAASMTDRI